MKTYPTIPDVEDAPGDLLDGGHLWLQEKVDGAHLQFQLLDSGAIQFGDRDRAFDPGDVPPAYQHAIRHVRERLDREALRAAVDDVESVTFFGEATVRRSIDYDWDRIPSFLGFDVWSGDRNRFLPLDAVEGIYERLGLQPVNTFRKEVHARDFDPDVYAIPDSRWYDGPPAGVVVRDKTGLRATIRHPEFEAVEPTPVEGSPAELAEALVTRERLEGVVCDLEDQGRAVTVDATFDRVFEAVLREEHGRLFHRAADVDFQAFRSEVASLVARFVRER